MTTITKTVNCNSQSFTLRTSWFQPSIKASVYQGGAIGFPPPQHALVLPCDVNAAAQTALQSGKRTEQEQAVLIPARLEGAANLAVWEGRQEGGSCEGCEETEEKFICSEPLEHRTTGRVVRFATRQSSHGNAGIARSVEGLSSSRL